MYERDKKRGQRARKRDAQVAGQSTMSAIEIESSDDPDDEAAAVEAAREAERVCSIHSFIYMILKRS